jgi:cyclic pyranopterin phosphate synthase
LGRRDFLSHNDILRYEEITAIVKTLVRYGVKKVRLTGGEPLIKRNIIYLIKMLKKIKNLQEISLTTNGVLLSNCIKELKKAGLCRVNVSLDTLKKDRFKEITGFDYFDKVWRSIELALKLKLSPVKINVVPIANINCDELIDFARLTLKNPVIVRFIEFFHTNERSKKLFSRFIPGGAIKKMISAKFGGLRPVNNISGQGPGVYYGIKNAKGAIGFINSTTDNFCSACRRLRLDCIGRLYPCMFSDFHYDMRECLRKGKSAAHMHKKVTDLIDSKPLHTKKCITKRCLEMSRMGG